MDEIHKALFEFRPRMRLLKEGQSNICSHEDNSDFNVLLRCFIDVVMSENNFVSIIIVLVCL